VWVAGVLFWGGVLGRFIESPLFPIGDVNEFSVGEKRGGGRPDFWEMVFWWTRKPLIGARSVIAGALLPDNFSPLEFKRLVRLWPRGARSPHRENPNVIPQLREYFSRVRLLDPFAGFGSIPLEAMRLGLGEVVAVELLPTAYVFLKVILEYPKRFGKRLIIDVERWGKWVIDRLREDPDIRELYDGDVAVYIGSWEIRCPHCGRYTPLIGNWWLARVSGRLEEDEEEKGGEEEGARSGVFRRLAWMTPYTSSGLVGIRVVDLNKELSGREIDAKVNAKQGTVEVSGRVYNVPRPNIDARRETATCLLCNNTIKNIGESKEWYVKEAIKEYNNNLERYLRGEITLENLLESRSKPKILVRVKVINGKLEFEPATSEDNGKLWKALGKLRQIWGDPDIPIELFAPYQMGTAGAFRITIWGFNKFYKLFNPRQLLALIKLVKLIRETSKQIEQEKVKEGLSKEEAFKYAEAVTTYLAIALVNHVRHNCLTTSIEPTQKFIAHALAFRGIAMTWNWVEEVPIADVLGSFTRSLNSISKGLSYLVSAISNSPNKILLDDATNLNKLAGEKFDLIITDPPYRDDVPYAELSDLYYVWLKRALSDIKEVFGVLKLSPRFHAESFFDEFGNEIETQWKAFALREISENQGRIRYSGLKTDALDYFKSLLSESFKIMASRLKDDSLLVTYYAHTSPDAWEALLEAGWLSAKMRITAAHAIATESAESVVARGKVRLDMAIVAVWRKGASGEALLDDVYARAVETCSNGAYDYRKAGFEGVNLFVAVLGKVLSQFTRYERLIGLKTTNKSPIKELVENYIYPATAEAIARSYGAAGAKLSPASMFYLLAKVLVGRRPRQVRRILDRTTAVILSIGTRSDLENLKSQNILLRDGERHILLEPRWGARNSREAIEDALTAKNLNPREPRIATAVDVLHLLEYCAIALPKEEFRRRADEIRGRTPALFDEATALARVLASGLPAEDPERELAKQVMDALGVAAPGTLDLFVRR
jgi:putative DNA methylase